MAESQILAHPVNSPRPQQAVSPGAEPAKDNPLRRFAALFEPTRAAAAPASQRELVLLAALVLIGALLSFWGLGAVGLHGDEKTMALPVMHLVRFGTPAFPSGMYYARGIGQLYLMAASVKLFGASEWALRLPSALCGTLLVPIAWAAGRRFLTPAWNLALTAAVAFLPAFVEDAHTARMYVFLVTCVAGYTALIFRWERTGRSLDLAAAVAMLILALSFHTLAIFAVLLTLYPGMLHGRTRTLLAGGAAFAVIALAFAFFSLWTNSFFPEPPTLPGAPALIDGPRAAAALPHLALGTTLAGVLLALAAGALVVAPVRRVGDALLALLIGAGLTALGAFADHLGVIVLLFGAAAVLRTRGAAATTRLLLLTLLSVLIVAGQLGWLHDAHVSLRQSLGAIAGWPSVWPYVALAQYSPPAMLALAAGAGVALAAFARGERLPEFCLFALLAVWVPLLLIGCFKWDVPMRYTAAQAFALLLSAFAAAQWLFQLALARGAVLRSVPAGLAAALAAVIAVNPVSLAASVRGGYADHPDHKGAAAFVRAQHPDRRDLIVAEDALEQTYYLGHIDYWLIGKSVASLFVHEVNGRIVDFYTDTPVIDSASELEGLIGRPDRGRIFIIGSGEDQSDGRRVARGPSLYALLASPQLQREVVYVGRDHLTKVWEIPAPPTPGDSAR